MSRLRGAWLVPLALPLRAPLATAHGPVVERRGWLIQLAAESGESGWGEALPLAGFTPESPELAGKALEGIARVLLGSDVAEPEPALALLDAAPGRDESPTAFAAAECALLDLIARRARRSLASQLAGCDDDALPRALSLAMLVAGDAVEAEVRAARAAGFQAVKLKLGAETLERDLERITVARRAGPELALRLDANRAFEPAQARALVAALREHGVDYVEEPLALPWASDPEAWRSLAPVSPTALAADESLSDSGLAHALPGAGAQVVVLKFPVLGGLRAARRLGVAARRAGARAVVTSFLDSALGRAAALQLAASLPDPREPAGLATAGLLASDVALSEAPAAERAVVRGAGLGVAPDSLCLASLRTGPTLELRA